MVRGTVVSLPHGTGKDVQVLSFSVLLIKKKKQKQLVLTTLVWMNTFNKIKQGWTDIDVIITMPSVLWGKLGALGRVLGPRGLMPNPKTGTVTMDIAKAVTEVKAGKIDFKVDKTWNRSCCELVKASFDAAKIARKCR